MGLGLTVSPDTLLSRVRQAASQPAFASKSVRVLGVDDWAFRRGHRYGTILVDLEQHRLVDLLPDRASETLGQWLQEHPGIEVVSRDRAEAYAQAVTGSAPEAQQVADRWHLLKNIGDALESALLRHYRHLKEATRQIVAQEAAQTPVEHALPEPTAPGSPNRAEREKTARREKRLESYEQVLQLHRQGYNQSAMSRQTGLSRRTIRKYLHAPSCPYYPETRRRRCGLLSLFAGYLKRRWEEGCHNGTRLLQEIQEQGYAGKYSVLKPYLQPWRERLSAQERQSTTGPRARHWGAEETPSPHSVRWWLLGHWSKSDVQKRAWQQTFVQTLCELCPEVGTLQSLAGEFVRMVKARQAGDWEAWLEKARASAAPEFAGLAKGFLQDKSAILAALSCEWSNGQTEGQVNRLKLIKRSMYGRTKFDLLKARVLPMRKAA